MEQRIAFRHGKWIQIKVSAVVLLPRCNVKFTYLPQYLCHKALAASQSELTRVCVCTCKLLAAIWGA